MTGPTLHDLVHKFGGQLHDGGRRATLPGPDHTRRDRSVSAVFGRNGRIVLHPFSPRDSWRDCAKFYGLPDIAPDDGLSACEREERRRQWVEGERRRIAERTAFCGRLWRETEPAEGTPASLYLQRRGIVGRIPGVLRYHPAAPRGYVSATRTPALVALVQDANGAPTGLHVTALSAEGVKAFGDRSRVMLGSTLGGAVRLFDVGDDGDLGVGEGLETCLSFAALHGTPCWAALSTAGLKAFSPPGGIKRLLIAADGDDAGKAAAIELAERARTQCDVLIISPGQGLDWNDALVGTSHE